MPELPEVEIVCRNLNEMMPKGAKIKSWVFFRKDLRFEIPQKALLALCGQKVLSIQRRAKYILIKFEKSTIISHLGMTGTWRREKKTWLVSNLNSKHDHLSFESGLYCFVYSDPRRFGFIEVIENIKLLNRFESLGVEPLDPLTDFRKLTAEFMNLKAPIKTSLMNQKLIVGVGNIYASEILFAAKVLPLRKSKNLNSEQFDLIWKHTKRILESAIENGGSTIENYRNGFGQVGAYQKNFLVYGREAEPCRICNTLIKQKTISGRSTFWCSNCQK